MLNEILLLILSLICLRFIIHFFQEKEANNYLSQHQHWKSLHLDSKKKKPLLKREIKKIMVTGGCGNFGSALIEMLCEKYPNSKIISLDLITKQSTEQVKYVKGNMTDIDTIFKYFKDVDAVFHTAAMIDLDGIRSKVLKINLQGAQNIVECCIENNVAYLIQTSSVSACQPPNGALNLTEEQATYSFYEAYGESKKYSEELVLEANGVNGLNTCAFITVGLWGAKDPHNFGSVVTMKDFVLECPSLDAGAQSKCYVENSAHGQILALENMHVANGQRYLIADDRAINTLDFKILIYEEYNKKKATFKYLPGFVFTGLGIVLYYWRWFLQPVVDVKVLTTKCHTLYAGELTFDISKIKKELNYKAPYTVEEAVKKAVKLYKENESSKK
eukprot:gene10492-3013_t